MRWTQTAAALAASALIQVVAWTLRLTVVGREHLEACRSRGRPVLLVFWHNRLLYTCYYLRRTALTMMISQSRDGDLIARVARCFGIQAVRGSTSRRGGRAVVELARAMRAGRTGGITPDGPRGPRYRLQPGALLAAQRAGAAVIPVSIAFSRRKVFRSWDRFRFPCPGARAVLILGEPLEVPPGARGEALDALAAELEARLRAVTARSDRWFGREPEVED